MTELCHDPRISDDPEHRIATDNPALIAAEYARRALPGFPVDWPAVAVAADACDATATIDDLPPAVESRKNSRSDDGPRLIHLKDGGFIERG